jgi:uncharacterized membrane protein
MTDNGASPRRGLPRFASLWHLDPLLGLARATARRIRIDWAALSAGAAFGLLYSWISYIKVMSRTAGIGDLGYNASVLHSIVVGVTTFHPAFPTTFVIQTPITLLIAPYYAVFPSIWSLLILQSIALAMSGIVVYYFVRLQFESISLALLIEVAYLGSAPTLGVAYYDFHFESLWPLFYALLCYCLATRRARPAVAFAILGSTIDPAGTVFVGLTLFLGLLPVHPYSWLRARYTAFRTDLTRSVIDLFRGVFSLLMRRRWEVLGILATLALFVLSSVGYSRQYSFATTPPFNSVSSHTSLVSEFLTNIDLKGVWLFLVVGPLAFLPLLNRRFLVFLTFVFIAFESNYLPYFQFQWQYCALYAIVLFIAMIEVLGGRSPVPPPSGPVAPRITSGTPDGRRAWRAVVGIVIATVVVTATFSVVGLGYSYGSIEILNGDTIPYLSGTIDAYDRDLYQTLSSLPISGSALVQVDMPELAAPRVQFPYGGSPALYNESPNIWYILPWLFNSSMNPQWIASNPYSFAYTYVQAGYPSQPDMADWISYYYNETQHSGACSAPAAPLPYSVYSEIDGALILERGALAAPAVYVPLEKTLIAPGGQYFSVSRYSLSPIGDAFLNGSGITLENASQASMWLSSPLYLGPGLYDANISLTSSTPKSNDSLLVEAQSGNSGPIFDSRTVTSEAFGAQGPSVTATLELNVTDPDSQVLLRGIDATWFGSLTLNSIALTQIRGPNVQRDLASSIKDCIPITVSNTAGTALGPTPVRVVLDSSVYARFINANWSNAEFVDASGAPVPTWIQSGASNASTATAVWLSLPSLAGDSSFVVDLDLFPKSWDLLSSHGPLGEAPELSRLYGQYDDGPKVFGLGYWNFQGNELPPGWTYPSSVSAPPTINDSLYVPPSSQTAFSTATFGPGTVLDAYGSILIPVNVTPTPSIEGIALDGPAQAYVTGYLDSIGLASGSYYGGLATGLTATAFPIQPEHGSTQVWSVEILANESVHLLNYGDFVTFGSVSPGQCVVVIGGTVPGASIALTWVLVRSPTPTSISITVG